MIVFASHNLIKDAPFTKLDLVTCRNLLIYLEPLAQKKVISLFHFGLKSGGVLLLGPSETPGELIDEFDSIDSQWRLFRKTRDKRLLGDVRLPLTADLRRARPTALRRATMPAAPIRSGLRVYDGCSTNTFPPAC